MGGGRRGGYTIIIPTLFHLTKKTDIAVFFMLQVKGASLILLSIPDLFVDVWLCVCVCVYVLLFLGFFF